MTSIEKKAAFLLLAIILLCFCMVTLGGYVRLSGSGYAIPEWPVFTIDRIKQPDGTEKVVRTVIPPHDTEGWEHLKATYIKDVPKDEGIALGTFKRMFWIEWSHRATGGLISFSYLAFLILVVASPTLRQRIGRIVGGGMALLLGIIVLGGVLVRTQLHAASLGYHLLAAFFFISLLVWLLMRLLHPPLSREEKLAMGANPLLGLAVAILGLVVLQIFSGGLMAGSMAGFMLNTWPKMGDYIVPPDMWADGGIFHNMIENKVVIQFTHRWFAFAVGIAVLFLVLRCSTLELGKAGRWAVRASLFTVVLQIVTGILTLLMGVHLHLALTHQFLGLVLMLNLLVIVYEAKHHKVLSEETVAEREAAAEKAGAGALQNA